MERIYVRDDAKGEDLLSVDLVGDAEARYHEIRELMTPLQGIIGISPRHGRAFGRDTVQDSTDAFYFLVSQLAYTEAKIFEKKYRPLQYEQFLPIDRSAGEAADSVRYETEDFAGEAEDMNLDADDIPEVQVNYGNVTMPLPYAGIGYSFSLEELRRSAFLKRPLSERKLSRARTIYEHKLNKVALFGNTQKGLPGFYNNPNVTVAANPSGHTWEYLVANDMQDALIADFNAAMNQAWAATEFTTIPNYAIISPAAYTPLLSPRASAANVSILTWLKQNNLATDNGEEMTIVPGYGLDGIGVSSANQNVFYNKDEDNLVMHIPMALRFVAPQQRGLKIFVPGEFKYGPAHIRRTPTVLYQQGV